LKFNQSFEKSEDRVMQHSGVMRQDWAARPEVPWLMRLLGKFVLDVLPAALASAIGGLLLAHYQFGRPVALPPVAAQAEPASAEMMAMVRDEHAMIMTYLDRQIAAERNRDVAADADSARAAADAKAAAEAKAADQVAAAAAPPPHRAASSLTAKVAHGKAVAAAPPQAPLVIAQAQLGGDGGVAPGGRPASDPDSLLAKTLDIKDHVVAATRQVVSAIGDAVASVGERIGGVLPGGRQFDSAS
jgi:hypothetical protein